jgi:hypothetical protein
MTTSIHRVGLAVAAVVTVVTVAGMYVADGYLSAQGAASSTASTPTGNVSSSPSATGTVPPEVVYVRPAPPPKVIHVTKAAPPKAPQVIHVTVPTAPGESGDRENDNGGD